MLTRIRRLNKNEIELTHTLGKATDCFNPNFKEYIKELKREIRALKQANIEYKEIIDKAIELTEKWNYEITDYMEDIFFKKDLLKILGGESNE